MPMPRKKITTKDTFYARKPFRANGHTYDRGQIFDWDKKSVAWRSVVLFYETGFLVTEPPTDTKTIAEAPVVEAVTPAVEVVKPAVKKATRKKAKKDEADADLF